jgi:hypothetical protein
MGILLLVAVAAGIGQAFVPEPVALEYGTVEGSVMYQGRPVTAGRIFFLEEGRHLSESIHAVIAADGYYRCPPYWVADRTTRRRYRIFVDLLDSEEPTLSGPTGHAARSGPSLGSVVPVSYPDSGARPSDQVARAATERSGSPDATLLLVRSPRHRFGDPRTTDLAVWLDHEPARVDVELTD